MNRVLTSKYGFRPVIGLLFGCLLGAVGCRDSAPKDIINQEDTTEAIVFVKTDGEETLNRSRANGNLYKLSPISPDGVVTPITDFVGAAVSDPCVSFDGEKILFSLRPQGAGNHNIYEINADGSGLRQVTAGGGDDFDPLYLPNGRIMFTSSRHGGMDEYNRAPAEVLYTCDYDGANITRRSFNMSDDFDPAVAADGSVIYTRWEHFGTFNRFPLFFCNPDGSKAFHKYGPHNRNFFHPQPMPDGRIIAIESTRVNEDAGPLAVLKLEMGPADPVLIQNSRHWDVLTPQVNNDGAPWPRGVFKYPFPLGGNKYVASYTLPAAEEQDVDYGLYTFTISQTGAGTDEDPATVSIDNLTFLYNDPARNEYDAQLLAPHEPPPVIAPLGDDTVDFGIFTASDVFNRSTTDGQEVPVKGVDAITEIAVIAGIPTQRGEPNDFSANTFEKRALLGYAPVYPDGSFRMKVPANTPISFATLDELRRSIVTKRTWIYVKPGEEVNECTGCHKDRGLSDEHITNPNPIARDMPASDVNTRPEDYIYINYRDQIAPIIAAKCVSCHYPTYVQRDTLLPPDDTLVTVIDTIPPPGLLDLTAVPDTTGQQNLVFPRAYINLSGESETSARQAVVPVFPRRSPLIDYIHGVGEAAAQGPHPASGPLTAEERELFTLWVVLGAQYR
ncbi:MAG: hypothetical protein GY838_13925 [bacterium]|nr:hypothetical protein [bacterium]